MQQAGTKEGAYYVTVRDGKRTAPLLGPFIDNHQAALDMVYAAKEKAIELCRDAVWYEFGTCRLPNDDSVPIRYGSLNKYFDMPH